MQSGKLSTRASDLNEYQLISQFIEDDQLSEFMTHAGEKAKKENRELQTFELKEGTESKCEDTSNTRAGMAYKYVK